MKILKFGAVWCNGCLVMKPRWAEIENENPWLAAEYYDYDTEKDMVDKYEVKSGVLPVFIFLDKVGKELTRLSGEVDKKKLIELIKTYRDR